MIPFAKPYLLFAVLSITCWAQIPQISVKQPVHGIPTRDKAAQSTPQTDFDVYVVVGNHLGVDLPIDQNGVYFVLTSPDVTEQEFGTVFYAWHNNAIYSNPGVSYDIKVAFAGDVHNIFSFCGVQDPSPNNNPDADSMANFVAHELEESVTDPDGTAWWDSSGNEIADKCQWTFGTTQTLPNGAVYNMKLGTRPYMIQRNWVNANGGYCALRW